MPEFALEGDELKKLIKVARKRPLAFAVVPGTSDEDYAFALHRKRQPDALGKALKKEAKGTKLAFGLCAVEGKVMTLTCEREVPSLAKKLKKWLKKQKAPYNVKILDVDGNLLDEDIEDLPDNPMYDEQADDAELFDEVDGDSTDPRIDQLRKRVMGLVPQIRAVGGDMGPKLQAAAKRALEQIAASSFDEAEQTIDRIEQALKRTSEQPASKTNVDPDVLKKLASALAELRPKVLAVPPPNTEKLMTAWQLIAENIRGKDAAGAAKRIKALKAALEKVTQTTESPGTPEADPLEQQWNDLSARITPRLQEVVTAGKGDPTKLRAALLLAEEKAADGDFKGAVSVGARLEEVLNKIQLDSPQKPDFEPSWKTARERWSQAIETVDGQISQFQKVLKTYDDPELKEISEFGLNAITANHKVLMMAAIQDVSGSGAAPEAKVLGAAAKRIAAFDSHLSSDPRIKAVDGNPFGVSMNVAGTLRPALAELNRVLQAAR